MPVPSKGNVSGFSCIQIFSKNSSGYATGQAGASPANGTTSHAYMTQDVSQGTFSPRTPAIVEFEAGNSIVGKKSYGGSDLQPFDVVGDAEDGPIMTLTNGSLEDTTTVSGWKIRATNSRRVVMPDMGVLMTNEFTSREDASKGTTYYRNVLIPACTIRCNIGGNAFQGKVPFTMNITPTSAGKFPNGLAFGVNQGWEGNEVDHYEMITENPLAITTFVGDAVATTFITGYRPVSTVITVSTRPNWWARAGVPTALTSIVVASGLATMPSAGSAAAMNILMYETQFLAVA